MAIFWSCGTNVHLNQANSIFFPSVSEMHIHCLEKSAEILNFVYKNSRGFPNWLSPLIKCAKQNCHPLQKVPNWSTPARRLASDYAKWAEWLLVPLHWFLNTSHNVSHVFLQERQIQISKTKRKKGKRKKTNWEETAADEFLLQERWVQLTQGNSNFSLCTLNFCFYTHLSLLYSY